MCSAPKRGSNLIELACRLTVWVWEMYGASCRMVWASATATWCAVCFDFGMRCMGCRHLVALSFVESRAASDSKILCFYNVWIWRSWDRCSAPSFTLALSHLHSAFRCLTTCPFVGLVFAIIQTIPQQKNTCAHNNTQKAHANGIKKKKRTKYVSTRGMDPKFLRNQKFCKKWNSSKRPHDD